MKHGLMRFLVDRREGEKVLKVLKNEVSEESNLRIRMTN